MLKVGILLSVLSLLSGCGYMMTHLDNTLYTERSHYPEAKKMPPLVVSDHLKADSP